MATFFDANGVRLFEPYNLVVMCFNAQFWLGLNSNETLVRTIIDTHNPDVIALQEFAPSKDNKSVYTTIFSDYPYHYFVGNAALAFVSKYELTDAESVTYATQGQETRKYGKAYITLNHQKICLLNTHLEILPGTEESREVRVAQAQELLNVMKSERYAISVGDFNCGDCHDAADADYIAVIKPFLDEGYHSANSSNQHGFLATYYKGTSVTDYTRYACIDEIITTSNIDINMVMVDKQKSDANTAGENIDHLPIIAYCRVNG